MNPDQFGQETMFCPFLPGDIVIDILLILPVKSLSRFKSVSKPFCSLIKNPNFISKHFAKTSKEKTYHLLIMGRHHKTLDVTVCLLITSLTKPRDVITPPLHLDVPFGLTSEKTRIVGSANGLVCLNLINHNGVAIVIWNPAINMFKPVPKSPNVSNLGKLTVTDLGFGYHPGNDDYMIVRLLKVATSRRKYEVEVYTLSTNSWRKIASDGRVLLVIRPFWRPMAPGMIVVKGVAYWVGVEVRNEEMCSVVVSLEMTSEELNFILPPIEPQGIVIDLREAITLRLFNLDESLVLIYSTNLEKVDIWMNNGFDIWVLNEDERTWTWRFKVEPIQGFLLEAGFWENSKALVAEERKEMCYGENGEYVYTKGETNLFLYDVIKGDFEIIENHELRAPFQAYSYLESLVPVNGGVDVAKEVDLSKFLDFDPLLF